LANHLQVELGPTWALNSPSTCLVVDVPSLIVIKEKLEMSLAVSTCQRLRSEQSKGGSTPVVYLFGGEIES
jgi:hypothetical protein